MNFNWGAIGIMRVKKNFKVIFNQLLILMMQMLLKGQLGMQMVGLNLN